MQQSYCRYHPSDGEVYRQGSFCIFKEIEIAVDTEVDTEYSERYNKRNISEEN